MKRAQLKRLFAMVLMVTVLVSANDTYRTEAAGHSSDILPWRWAGGADGLTIQLFSDEFEPYLSDAAFDWNYIDPNVDIPYIYYSPTSHPDYGCDIRVYSGTFRPGEYGSTSVFGYSGGAWVGKNILTYTGEIARANIYLDVGTDPHNLLDQGETFIEAIITHEIGHALALNHPSCTESSIMYSSPANIHYCPYITEHDRDNLCLKW